MANFSSQIEHYLVTARTAMPAALKRSAIRHRLGRLQLWLENETVHNFSEVVVDLSLPHSGVSAYFDRFGVEGPEFPSPPAPWGTTVLHELTNRTITFSTGAGWPVPDTPRLPRGATSNSGESSRVVFDPVHVRPLHVHSLGPFYLLTAPEYAGEILRCEWTATATDTSGFARGELDIPVARDVPTYDALLSPPDTDAGEDD